MLHTLRLDIDGPLATLSLNRPMVRNAFNAEMIDELTEVCSELGRRDEVRAVVLRGEGKCFSAGADVEWMRASLECSAEENVADALRMSDMLAAIDSLPQPVIARVHGACLGGGMGLLAVCDIVVSGEDVLFGFTEVRLGIIPAAISRFVLPKLGQSWARALYLTGERFDAEVAQRIGLVHWIVPSDTLDDAVEKKARHILAGGPIAVRAAKALVRELAGRSSADAREVTARRIAGLRASDEGQEGLRAFLAKRSPNWLPES